MTLSLTLRYPEKFASLPEDFQQGIKNIPFDLNLQDLHKKYHLHIDQSAKLEELIAEIIFGELHTTDLIQTIVHSLYLDEAKSQELALDINQKILLPIREEVKRLQTISGTNTQ